MNTTAQRPYRAVDKHMSGCSPASDVIHAFNTSNPSTNTDMTGPRCSSPRQRLPHHIRHHHHYPALHCNDQPFAAKGGAQRPDPFLLLSIASRYIKQRCDPVADPPPSFLPPSSETKRAVPSLDRWQCMHPFCPACGGTPVVLLPVRCDLSACPGPGDFFRDFFSG